MVSVLLACPVEWRWCAVLSCSARWRDVASAPARSVHGSEYCDHVMLLSRCHVLRCGAGVCLCVVFVWWGTLCPPSPSLWWRVGHCGWWALVVVVGGMTSEGRLRGWPPRLQCQPSRSCVGVPIVWYRCPLSVCSVVLLNGGRVVLRGVPRLGWYAFVLSCSPLCCVWWCVL